MPRTSQLLDMGILRANNIAQAGPHLSRSPLGRECVTREMYRVTLAVEVLNLMLVIPAGYFSHRRI